MIINGKYDTAVIFASEIEDTAKEQIQHIVDLSISENAHTRIMSDVHAGANCVIGYTMKITKKVVPNLIGPDIGCGVLAVKLEKNIDINILDEIIEKIFDVDYRPSLEYKLPMSFAKVCKMTNQSPEEAVRGLGTLGGGNHFCELDVDKDGNQWLCVHTGSRSFGGKIAKHFQNIAKRTNHNKERNDAIAKLKEQYTSYELGKKIAELPKIEIARGLEYLTGRNMLEYIFCVEVATVFAHINRCMIINNILYELGGANYTEFISSTHNYIEQKSMILRKGAISAYEGEKVVIPLNMRDGMIIGIGKGNEEWNYSAPHGAGRVMSRTQAKENISLEDFKKSMEGIHSTCISELTIDEAPFAYKAPEAILSQIGPTVEVVEVLKPVWNYKASE